MSDPVSRVLEDLGQLVVDLTQLESYLLLQEQFKLQLLRVVVTMVQGSLLNNEEQYDGTSWTEQSRNKYRKILLTGAGTSNCSDLLAIGGLPPVNYKN